MSEKKIELKLVPQKKKRCVNCFFNSCPRKLEYLPEEECPMGKPEFTSKKNILKEPACPWWINSKEDNYCFWKYLKRKSRPDGTMVPLLQNEIAKLFGCSSTKIHFILKGGIEKLQESAHSDILEEHYDSIEDKTTHDRYNIAARNPKVLPSSSSNEEDK